MVQISPDRGGRARSASPPPAMAFAPPAAAAATAVQDVADPPPAEPVVPPTSGETVTAPMVGTFYSAAAPGARPFVDIGTEVQVGDTLCIIEAMKMMNQIESEVAGKVTAVLANNGDPVEFGQPLFIVE